jgi:SAM-dependent methyltransferase
MDGSMSTVKNVVMNALPSSLRKALVSVTRRPPIGRVDFGSLRRLKPISNDWGFDRGVPVDRYYIERFLERHAHDVRGRVLEVADNEYTRRFGGDRVTRSDVLHDTEGSPRATLVADLARAEGIAAETFDAVICTQTLQLVYDVHAAVGHLFRILKPGGVLLATVPSITPISREDMDRTGDFWRFTVASASRLFEGGCPGAAVEIAAHGNVLAAAAFLYGIAAAELSEPELAHYDPDYQMLVTVRVQKAEGRAE